MQKKSIKIEEVALLLCFNGAIVVLQVAPPPPAPVVRGGGSGPRRGHSAHIHTMTPRRTHTHNDILNVFILVEVFLERKWAFRSQSLLRFFMHKKTNFPLISFYLKLFINNFFRMATLIYILHIL